MNQALVNAAEQFVAACGDGNAAQHLPYFADIFAAALKARDATAPKLTRADHGAVSHFILSSRERRATILCILGDLPNASPDLLRVLRYLETA